MNRLFALVSLLFLFLLVIPSLSFSQVFLNENFERDQNSWPWMTTETSGWECEPWPAFHPDYTWGVEREAIYRYIGNDYVQSLWCCGLPNNLIAGSDDYMPGQESWAIWGPFSTTQELISIVGRFYLWADSEPWNDGEGDNFYMLAAEDPEFTNMEDWNIAFDLSSAEDLEPGSFNCISFDLNQTWDWNGNSVNMITIGEATDDLYIAFVFISDDDDNTGSGVFIDDIFMHGYPADVFDFAKHQISFCLYDDGEYRTTDLLCMSDNLYTLNNFSVFGITEIEVQHVLYVNEDVLNPASEYVPVDTMTGRWSGSSVDYTFFTPRYETPLVFSDTGLVGIKVVLDVENIIEETDEENNVLIDTVRILMPQTQPEMEWLELGGAYETDSLVFVDPSSPTLSVRYHATNHPVEELASFEFFIGSDMDSVIQSIPQSRVTIDNEEHLAEIDMATYPLDTPVYFGAYLVDRVTDPVYSYAPKRIVSTNSVGDDTEKGAIPGEFQIVSAYPNPFNPTVELTFTMPQAGEIELRWYSLEGRLVSRQIRTVSAGYPVLSWTPDGLASGVYLLQAHTPFGVANARVIYLK